MRRLLVLLILVIGCQLATLPTLAKEQVRTIEQTTFADDDSIKTITVRTTGFFSKSTAIVRYRSEDGSIVSVEKNGEFLPSSKFKDYEETVHEMMNLEILEGLEPTIEAVTDLVDDVTATIEEKLEIINELVEAVEMVEPIEGSIAETTYDYLSIRRHMVLMDSLRVAIMEKMRKTNETWLDEVMTVKIGIDDCLVNGKEVSEETSKYIMELYQELRGEPMEEKETVEIHYD
jgi:hypothetical protein